MDKFASGRFTRRYPIHVPVASVALVMVNVDEKLSLRDELADFTETLKAGAIRGDDQIKLLTRLRFLHGAFRIEESIFLRE